MIVEGNTKMKGTLEVYGNLTLASGTNECFDESAATPIAGIWVAFFQECQRYRVRTGRTTATR